jgi:polygalacturonase
MEPNLFRRRMLGLTGGAALAGRLGAAATAEQAAGSPAEPYGRLFDVKSYGAAGNGEAEDTAAIQKAIDACHDARGGIVYFPPGSYLTGTIQLKSNVTLYLHVGATIQGSKQLADYDLFGQIEPALAEYFQPRYLIYANDAHNIGTAGRGKIDGSGRSFWRLMTKAEIEEVLLQRPEGGRVAQDWYRWLDRPGMMIELEDCKNVRLEGIRLENAPIWTVHPLRCDSVFIDGVTIRNPLYGPNVDGIDVDSCSNVMISNCDIYTCDDAIVVFCGSRGAGTARSRNITVTNCVLCTTCNAIKVYAVANASVENLTFSDCAVYGDPHPKDTGNSPYWQELQDFRTMSGIYLMTPITAQIRGLTISNITMEDVRNLIFMRATASQGSDAQQPADAEARGTVRDVLIDNVFARGQGLPSMISGLPGHDIENVSISHAHITTAEGGRLAWAHREPPEFERDYAEAIMLGNLPSYGMYCRHVNGLKLRDVEYVLEEPDMRPALMFDDVKNLDIDSLAAKAPPSGMPVMRLKQVRRAFIRGCSASPGTGTYLQVEGEWTEKISLMGNDLSEAGKPISLAEGVKSTAVFASGNWMPQA